LQLGHLPFFPANFEGIFSRLPHEQEKRINSSFGIGGSILSGDAKSKPDDIVGGSNGMVLGSAGFVAAGCACPSISF
jgi:hypothetical protein